MSFVKVKLNNNDHRFKIKLKDISWDVLMINKEILFDSICDLLLDYENLMFYASQKASCKTLESLRKEIITSSAAGRLENCIDDILTALGWFPIESIDIDSDVFSGDIGELLMCILIDRLGISKTIISKVSLKTSPKVSAHQNDNVFYDIDNKILYYGESKFYSTLYNALYNAVVSLKKHSETFVELSYIKTHTATFIADDEETKLRLYEDLEYVSKEDVTISSITFVMESDKYLKNDIEHVITLFSNDYDSDSVPFHNCYVVVLPILDKKEFLNHLKNRVAAIHE